MKTYIFDPLSSITAYELAQVLRACKLMVNQAAIDQMSPFIRQHFQEVSEIEDGENRDNYQGA